MSLDPRIRDAVWQTVQEFDQDSSLAIKLVAWMEALSEQNESLDDVERKWMHVELLYDATQVEPVIGVSE